MTAKALAFKIGVATVFAATAVWAAAGHDSMINNIVDDLRAWRARGRLVQVSDNEPVGKRYVILFVLGRNGSKDPDGPSEGDLRNMLALTISDWKVIYPEMTRRQLLDDVVVFGYWYNSDLADPKVANDLFRKLESHPYFTQADAVYSAVGYSKGTNILFWHWTDGGDRKMETVVGSGGPQLGAPLADETIAKQAISKTLGLPMALIERGFRQMQLDLSSEGTQWLTPMYGPLIERRRQYPLSSDWFLLAGTTIPSGGSKLATYFDVANWLDSVSLGEGVGQDIPAYRLGARALMQVGVENGSDGMVPVSSALCEGLAGGAHTFILQNHNHSQMLQGNGGTELHRQMLICLLPKIVAHQDVKVKAFDTWLPELPSVDLFPIERTKDLAQAQLVGVNSRGDVAGLTSSGQLTQFNLPAGQYSWPQWIGETELVAERMNNGSYNIVAIRSNGSVVQLTSNGRSRYPVVQDDGRLVVFQSEDDLVVRSMGGMAQVLVAGNVNLDSPPVFLGDTIYFSNLTSDGRHELRKVKVGAKQLSMGAAQVVAADVAYPIRVGDLLLAFQRDGGKLKPIAVTKNWTGLVDFEVQLALQFLLKQSNLPSLNELEVTNDGQVYVGMDGSLRRLDVRKLPGKTLTRLEELRRRIKGYPPQPVPTVTLDEVLPMVARDFGQVDSK